MCGGWRENSVRNTAEMTCFAKTNPWQRTIHWAKFWLSLKSKRKAVFSNSGLNDTLNSSRKEFRLTSDFFKATFTVRRKGAISTRFSGNVWLKILDPDKIQVKRNGNQKYSQTCFWISYTMKNKIRTPIFSIHIWWTLQMKTTQNSRVKINPSEWRSYCKITGTGNIWIKPRFFSYSNYS